MTRLQMEAVINAGGTVLWNGRILYTIGDLPTQEEIDALLTIGNGPSAYAVAVENGFVGTEAEWLASLIGPEGPQGEQGEQGIQGEPGADGADGTGAGDVIGPASSTDSHIVLFDGATGKLLKDGGVTLASKQDALGFTPVPNTRTVNSHALSADVTVTKGDVGLGNVDNTSDTDKPVSTAQQTAIDGKVSDTAYNATSWDGVTTIAPSKNAVRDKVEALATDVAAAVPNTRTVAGHALSADVTVSKSDVGLSNVDNTADTAKPVSTAQQTAIDGKVSDTAYNAGTWDGVTTIAPSKNAVRDKIESLVIPVASDTAYDATTWNGNTDVPTKNAVRDKIETMGGTTDVQTFNADGTWNKPAGVKIVKVEVIGSGGGGGGGARNSSTTVIRGAGRCGGGGSHIKTWFLADDLPSSVAIVVGAGGTSGAGATSNASAGSNGGTGGVTKFGTGTYPSLIVNGGTGGTGGAAAAGTGTDGTGGAVATGPVAGPGSMTAGGGTGGGAGGTGGTAPSISTGVDAAPFAGGGGGAGGFINASNALVLPGTGSDGTSNGTANGGSAGADGANGATVFAAGGGGAASKGGSVVGWKGGNGGVGGGAGGGGSADSAAGGAGGVGGAGRVIVTSW